MSRLYFPLETVAKSLAGKGNRGYWGAIREGGPGKPELRTFE